MGRKSQSKWRLRTDEKVHTLLVSLTKPTKVRSTLFYILLTIFIIMVVMTIAIKYVFIIRHKIALS